MKDFFLASLALVALLSGCGDASNKSAQTTNAPSGNPLNAPADYLGSIGKAQQSAIKTIDTTSIDKALQMFNVDNGRYPKDLNELVEKKYLPHVPEPPYGMKIVYDPSAGQVKIVKQ